MAKALGRFAREAREILPAFVFFSVAFSIVIVTDALYVKGYPINTFHFAGAVILALIVSKAMLVANMLPFLDAFPHKPLVYNTIWKTTIYTALATLTYFTERIVRLAAERAGLTAPDPRLHTLMWSRFWMVLIWLLVAFLIFVGYTELDRKLGGGKLRRIFFSTAADQDG